MFDHEYLRRAISLAEEARAQGNPPFGSLLVSDSGVVLAEERNTTATDRDLTAHPELKLARWAGRELPVEQARSTTMYTSCEPCPMCASVIPRANLGRVVYALSGEQLDELKSRGFAHQGTVGVAYSGPHLPDEAAAAFAGYYD